jgi:hypothetical protein
MQTVTNSLIGFIFSGRQYSAALFFLGGISRRTRVFISQDPSPEGPALVHPGGLNE